MSIDPIKIGLEEFEPISGLDGYVSTRKSENERIVQAREGVIPQGLETGFVTLDRNFRIKQGNLVIMNGHDNVGKSFIAWYIMLIASVKHNWRWIMFCAENVSPDIRTQLVEFMCGKLARSIPEDEFSACLEFAYEHFEIIEISEDKDELETLDNILKIAEALINESDFNGLLIDPYNSLDIDLSNLDRRLSTHDYHYACAKKMRKFNKKHSITTWVNMHAVSEALRRTDKEGYPLPPGKADTEGGGKFSNRADEFITWHRYVQDSARAKITECHVRKIKDTKTGGKCTDLNSPVLLSWEGHNGFWGFYDEYGNCPLTDKKRPDYVMPEKFPETENNFDQWNNN